MEATYNFITSDSLILYLIGFIAISYVLVGLLTWSFIKPLKYLGFPIIIVGITSFGLKGVLKFIVEKMDIDGISILKIFINSSGNLFIKYAIICLTTGIIMIVSYYILNRALKTSRRKHNKLLESNQENHIEEYETESEVDDESESYDENQNISE